MVYWECISRLFSIMEHQLSFGVERDVLVDELEFYFNQENAAQLVEEEFQANDSRGRANGILRKLEYYGWIEVETDKSYVQRVNFKEYAVKVIKTLLDIADGKQIEYQGYIYTIYSLVRGNMDRPGIVLMQIWENTDFLITGLKNLNSNIKHYIDELTRHSTVPGQFINIMLDIGIEVFQTGDEKIRIFPNLHQHDSRPVHIPPDQTVYGVDIALIFDLFTVGYIKQCFDHLHCIFFKINTLHIAFICFHLDPAVIFQLSQNAVCPSSAVICLKFFFHKLCCIFLVKIEFKLIYQHISFHSKGKLMLHNGKKTADTFPVNHSVWRRQWNKKIPRNYTKHKLCPFCIKN